MKTPITVNVVALSFLYTYAVRALPPISLPGQLNLSQFNASLGINETDLTIPSNAVQPCNAQG